MYVHFREFDKLVRFPKVIYSNIPMIIMKVQWDKLSKEGSGMFGINSGYEF